MNRDIVKLALLQHAYRQHTTCGCGAPCDCGCRCGWLPPPFSSAHYYTWADHVLDMVDALSITPAPVDGVQAAAEQAARALTPYIAEYLQQPRSPGYGPSRGADHIRSEATRAAMSWQPYKDFRAAFVAEVERLLAADTAPQEVADA